MAEPTTTDENTRRPAAQAGGEAACWLTLVCDVCGALNERTGDSCWRCDTPVDSD
ncbi:ribosomal protein L40E [Mycetocola sp. CAN_C7]|uniref:hypothetical protein n=1 Tax=Mycetocola sp. CAN_C7 TaxID=2787724 RepID=UPI0018CB8722